MVQAAGKYGLRARRSAGITAEEVPLLSRAPAQSKLQTHMRSVCIMNCMPHQSTALMQNQTGERVLEPESNKDHVSAALAVLPM